MPSHRKKLTLYGEYHLARRVLPLFNRNNQLASIRASFKQGSPDEGGTHWRFCMRINERTILSGCIVERRTSHDPSTMGILSKSGERRSPQACAAMAPPGKRRLPEEYCQQLPPAHMASQWLQLTGKVDTSFT
jgi:hypothetical protein